MSKRKEQRAITDIHALTADPQNANRGTARGRALLRESLTTCGQPKSYQRTNEPRATGT